MPTVRLIILLTALAVSAYAVYSAGVKVESLSENEKAMSRYQKGLSTSDYSFMHRAVELSKVVRAHDADAGAGSVVVLGGKIVGEGVNQVRALKDPSAHAEVQAIREAGRSIGTDSVRGASIYITREPCAMCLSVIYTAGIEKIYYRYSEKDSIPSSRRTHIQSTLQMAELERLIPRIPMKIDAGPRY